MSGPIPSGPIPAGPLGFFRAQHQAFHAVLKTRGRRPDLIEGLLSQAVRAFDANVELQAKNEPPIDCGKGCSACCTLRVMATAPEIFLVARYIREVDAALKARGIDLPARIAQMAADTKDLSEEQRLHLRRPCPFIFKGICLIHAVRPLACRGLASHDRRACADAAAGRSDHVPTSQAHLTVRGLVQNALQAALRQDELPWAAYELNQALTLELASEPSLFDAWSQGEDVFAPALIPDQDLEDMARTFDQIATG